MRPRPDLPYDKKFLLRCLLGLAGIIVLMKLTGGSGFVVLFAMFFACFSKKSDELLLYTLLVSVMIVIGNPNLIPKGGIFSLSQRLLMLTMSLALAPRLSVRNRWVSFGAFGMMFLYLGYMIIPSAAGWCPTISFLKLILFSAVYLAYLGVAKSIVNSRSGSKCIRSLFLMMAIFFIAGSLFIIPLGWGQMGGEDALKAIQAGEGTSLFMGMASHSQALGPTVSVLGVMLYVDWIFSVRRPNKLYAFLLACVPLLIWKTSSRTALGAFMAGIAFATFMFSCAGNIRSNWKAKVTSMVTMMVVMLSIVVVALPQTRAKAAQFALKHGDSEKASLTFENVTMSRRGTWEAAMANFKKKPDIGNGFQVSDEFAGRKVSLMTLSAPVEKGVWISAILEEGGVIGMMIFLVFCLAMFSSLLRQKCYMAACAFFMLLVTNLGEFTMFSMSYIGAIIWVMVFLGIILDVQRKKDEQGFNYRRRPLQPPAFNPPTPQPFTSTPTPLPYT